VPRQVPYSPEMLLQGRGGCIAQPLPADEQLALLFHLAGTAPLVGMRLEALSPTHLGVKDAYQTCKQITRHHSKSFYFSNQFLPADKRRSIYALYAFCRTSDDTVDLARDDPARALAEWVHQARGTHPPPDDPVLLAWHDTRSRYRIPSVLSDELLAGIAMDLTIHRYDTFADLWIYCYRVASVVGLLSMSILGAAPGAEAYAIKLGVALQLTNILRDVGEDARRGRVYLPLEDLKRFGLSADDILAGVHDERFVALMRFEIARTHRLYEESWPGIALLSRDSRMAVGVAAQVYRGILDKIVMNQYDVFHRRAHLSLSEKFRRLPRIWAAVRRLGRQKQGSYTALTEVRRLARSVE
jgi:15-cis-phytoene synthase